MTSRSSPCAPGPLIRSTLSTFLLLCACGDETSVAPDPAGPAAAIEALATPHTLAVCATASLRRAFGAIARRYEQEHPGASVTLHFDGGTQLLAAMNAGERCDVIAVGDSSVMARITSAGHTAVGSPAELARNRVAIAVANGNPKQVQGLADLGREDLRLALGARTSSIGRHSRWVLSRLHLAPNPAFEAATAEAVLAKVASGDADAGIVYATSFADAGSGVQRIDVPSEQNTPALYSISAARGPTEPLAAAAFRALALGPIGQELLGNAGFLPIGAKLD
jgi:molybdate transport system substrate-binding protein